MCINPKRIPNPKYTAKSIKKHIPTPRDECLKMIEIPCGYCSECRKKRKRDWQVRLTEELKENKIAKFVTLTFSEESLNKLEKEFKTKECNGIASRAVKRFCERWRKEFGKQPRHWFVTEIGGDHTERIHLHGLIFENVSYETIKNKWMYGNIWIGKYVSQRTINYISKYILKEDEKHEGFKGQIYASKGIGKSGIDKNRNGFNGDATIESYRLPNGRKISLPDYYRKKIYSDEEREELRIIKNKKGICYIGGVEVKTTNYEEIDEIRNNMFQKERNLLKPYKKGSYNTRVVMTERERMEADERNKAARDKNYKKKIREYLAE